MVDGTGTIPGSYLSITDAVVASVGAAAPIFEVEGMTDANGVVAYDQTFETFPITLPPGSTLKPHSSTAVFIWDSTGGTTPTDLIHLSQAFAPVIPAKIRGINFSGGNNAIFANASSPNKEIEFLVMNCRFSNCRYGVTAFSTNGGETRVRVKDCSISSKSIQTGGSPVAQSPRAGLRFHAYYYTGTDASFTNAEVIDLVLEGTFPNMDSQVANTRTDLTVATTRLVEVFAQGDDGLRQYPDAPDYTTVNPIPEVHLNVIGGDWAQMLQDGQGWDTAIHAEATSEFGQNIWDYHAGFNVQVSGTSINSFREDGIYCGTFHNARGLLSLSSSTQILGTGQGEAFDEQRHSAVHLFSWESYTGMEAGTSSFSKNVGNGIYANTEGNLNSSDDALQLVVPMGLYLKVLKCAIHNNDANGIFLRNLHESQPSGFIGGTIHQDSTGAFNIESDGEGFSIPHGQGLIHRTAISNNGKTGIKVRISGGNGIVPDDADSAPSGVALRVSNDFIWNNPFGGVDVHWAASSYDNPRKGLNLMPLTHCTLVENGNSLAGAGWSMEIDDSDGAPSSGRAMYAWDEPATVPYTMRTMVWNSILVRDVATGFGADLGPVLNFSPTNSDIDLGNIALISDDQVGFAGVRAKAFWGNAQYPFSAKMTDEVNLPFIGSLSGYSLQGTDTSQFHLVGIPGSPQIIDKSPFYFHVNATETAWDFDSDVRPAPSTGLRDKGADEL